MSLPTDPRTLPLDLQTLDPVAHARLMDKAKSEAQRMRQETVRDFGQEAFADVWRGANAVWQRSWQSGQQLAERSAVRLQSRLAHHRALRKALAPALVEGASATPTSGQACC